MRPQLLSETIKAHHRVRVPMIIEGEPGVGKSSIPEQVARDMGIGFMKFNVPTRALEDYGVPAISGDGTKLNFAVADNIFPFVGSDTFPDEGILVADELSSAALPEQKLWMCIIQDRHLHEHRLKPGWSIVATGNRTKDRAGANRLISALSDRMTRYTMDMHLDDWCNWAFDAGVSPMVISFLRFKPALLAAFDANQDVSPTPRSWAERVSPFVESSPPMPSEFETYQGSVGEGAAAEFMGFIKLYRSLPNIDAVLMAPDSYEVPDEPAVLYALSGALGARATKDNFERLMTFAKRMPAEFMVLTVRDAIKHDKAVMQTPTYVKWCSTDGAILL